MNCESGGTKQGNSLLCSVVTVAPHAPVTPRQRSGQNCGEERQMDKFASKASIVSSVKNEAIACLKRKTNY